MNAGFQLNAFDPNSLGDLKRLARSEGQQDVALRAAAKQFEALFLQMVMKSMRDATPASSLMDSEQTKMYQSLLDQQMALNMSQSRGAGLSEVIYRQLGGKDAPAAAVDGQAGAGAAGNAGIGAAGNSGWSNAPTTSSRKYFRYDSTLWRYFSCDPVSSLLMNACRT